jgi:hypothetical protein
VECDEISHEKLLCEYMGRIESEDRKKAMLITVLSYPYFGSSPTLPPDLGAHSNVLTASNVVLTSLTEDPEDPFVHREKSKETILQ